MKIVVGLSGGIDSSMALLILKKQGWDPVGVHLKLPVWQGQDSINKLDQFCRKIKVPLEQIDVQNEFREKVVNYFVDYYQSGKTPNPCIICNRLVKFQTLFAFAKKNKINFVATGHYAKILQVKSLKCKVKNYFLSQPKDKVKDQTYNLSYLPRKWLKNLIFPLGEWTKKEIIKLAKKEGFGDLIRKKQSQDFCYLGESSTGEFLTKTIGQKPGNIVNNQGKILGRHQGLHFYTLGQRKGIYLSGGPFFVCGFNQLKNELIVTNKLQDLLKKKAVLSPFNFLVKEPKKPIKVLAKIRYRSPLSKAILFPPKNKQIKIVFAVPQKAVTPGQWCVFYLPADLPAVVLTKVGASAKVGLNDVCFGGGMIN